MNLKIDFDDLAFRAAMNQAVTKLKASAPELVREEARLFVTEYMKMTPPFAKGRFGKGTGGNKQDLEAGIKAVVRDLAQVAGRGERGFLQFVADTFGVLQVRQQLFKKGSSKPYLIDWDKVAFSVDELARHHRSKMNKYGHPPSRRKGAGGRGQADNTIGRWVAKEKVIVPSEIYYSYLQTLKDAIGSAKGAFNAAMIRLGGKLPWWVARHGARGSYVESGTNLDFSVTISGKSQVPAAQKVVNMAVALRAKKLTAEVRRIAQTFARTGKIVTRRKSFNT